MREMLKMDEKRDLQVAYLQEVRPILSMCKMRVKMGLVLDTKEKAEILRAGRGRMLATKRRQRSQNGQRTKMNCHKRAQRTGMWFVKRNFKFFA